MQVFYLRSVFLTLGACCYPMAESNGAFTVSVSTQADGSTVVAIGAGHTAHCHSAGAFCMGVGTDSNAAGSAVGNRVICIIFVSVCDCRSPETVGPFCSTFFTARVNGHFYAGSGPVADGQVAFAKRHGRDTQSSTVITISAGRAAHGQGTVAFRMGIGTHGDAAHVHAAFVKPCDFITHSVTGAVSCCSMVCLVNRIVRDYRIAFRIRSLQCAEDIFVVISAPQDFSLGYFIRPTARFVKGYQCAGCCFMADGDGAFTEGGCLVP